MNKNEATFKQKEKFQNNKKKPKENKLNCVLESDLFNFSKG